MGLRKGNLKSETESLQIAAQNNAIRTYHIKARIDKTQHNSKWRLCGYRDEAINHIINECSKLARKEYKTRHDLVGKLILWEMCKNSKFHHRNKWYMHNLESILENDTHKPLWAFHIQTDHLISARRPDLIVIKRKKKEKKKRSCRIVDFAVPADNRIKLKGNEKKISTSILLGNWKKLWNMKVTIIPIVIGAFGTVTKRLLKRPEELKVGGRVKTSKLQHYWDRQEYWAKSWRLEETSFHSNIQ